MKKSYSSVQFAGSPVARLGRKALLTSTVAAACLALASPVFANGMGANYTDGNSANGIASIAVGYDSKVEGNGVEGNGAQGATSISVGTLNTVKIGGDNAEFDGVANTVVGQVNSTENANAAVIYGAANVVKNSYRGLSDGTTDYTVANGLDKILGAMTDKDLAQKLIENSGGQVMVMGGANLVDGAIQSQVMGVGNTLTGSSTTHALDYIEGFHNTIENSRQAYVIGSANKVSETTSAIVYGDNRTLSSADGSVVIGSADKETATSVKNATVLGNNANVTVEGGVALGSDSVASDAVPTESGYDPSTKTASTDTSSTWRATRAAVSVGDAANDVTRRITGVAAGSADTDAVNVAQLKLVKGDVSGAVAEAQKHSTVVAGSNITVAQGTNAAGGVEYTVATSPNVSFDSVTVGNVKVDKNGINAGNQKITNVAAGEVSATSTDAVNGSQLYQVQQSIGGNSEAIGQMNRRINDLDEDIAKTGATAAALAALHPADFDPEHRFMLSAGLGHYKSRTGVAVGAFLYPTDTGNLLLSLGYASAASDSHMVNAGLTYRFGGSAKPVTKLNMQAKYDSMAAENRDLTQKVGVLTTRNAELEKKYDKVAAELAQIKAALKLK
ncbi:MAG: YadA-like family protein [Mesosutterella sp.]|nr:YadA-like family protein [Mesosutterella sp.]